MSWKVIDVGHRSSAANTLDTSSRQVRARLSPEIQLGPRPDRHACVYMTNAQTTTPPAVHSTSTSKSKVPQTFVRPIKTNATFLVLLSLPSPG